MKRHFSNVNETVKMPPVHETSMEWSNAKNGNASYDLNLPLKTLDPEMYELIQEEKDRQRKGLEMIASENFTTAAVMDCLGSCLHNKYSEGQPGARYYGGNHVIDKIELLAQDRARQAFGLEASQWGVNVQPYSGSPANFAVYTALVGPHGRIMGLDLPDGGHLSHGFYTPKKKISATSIFFESLPYKVNPETGLIDYEALARDAMKFRPKMIVAGVSCYTRKLDYSKFRKIADDCGALLMADMAHVAGLVAAGLQPSPFEYCDIVTSTVHKTLRGPRAGIIFFRKGVKCIDKSGKEIKYEFEDAINNAVFPGLQGGPHNTAIAGIAVAMGQAASPKFKEYQQRVVANAQELASQLQDLGYTIVTGGTDNHIVLVDLRSKKLSGSKAELILEEVGISVNKNTVPGDKSAMNPSGIRFGTPPLSTRGVQPEHIKNIVGFIDQAWKIAMEIQAKSGPKLVDFNKELHQNQEIQKKIKSLEKDVTEFALHFPLPGYDEI